MINATGGDDIIFMFALEISNKCGRHNEIIDLLIKTAANKEKDFSDSEKNYLSESLKKQVTKSKHSLLILKDLNTDPSNSNSNTEYIRKIEKETEKNCLKVIKLIDNYLISRSENSESKVFYLRLKADCYKYIAENDPQNKEDNDSSALYFYNLANEEAANLNFKNFQNIMLIKNYSAFQKENLNNNEESKKIIKGFMDKLETDKLRESDFNYDDFNGIKAVISIIQKYNKMK